MTQQLIVSASIRARKAALRAPRACSPVSSAAISRERVPARIARIARIALLQRALGNRRVAQLIRAGRLTPHGRIAGIERTRDRHAPDLERMLQRDTAQVEDMDKPATTTAASRHIQRRLIVSGSSEALVTEYLTLVGNASGLRLNWNFAQPRVTVGGNLPGAVPAADGRSNILSVINHPTQNAELHIGTNQPRVAVGAFPAGASTIQTIDMDDIRNLNAALPGQGTAKAFHEMMENFNAHGIGFGNFAASHARGLEAESDVLENQGIVGRRLSGGVAPTVIPAPPGQPTAPNITYLRQLQDFTHYFLEIIQRRTTGSPTGPGADFEVVSARRIPKVQVSQRTVDSFVSGSNAVPAAGNVVLATALADLNANPNSTLLIEGFADNVGTEAANRTTSRNRAATAQAFFVANGIAADRIAIVGRGETSFVATNANEAGRLQNRRIVMTVHRPGP
jgi:outer membrane protein OmpA-like peptidoglycan-associated protein